MAVPRRSAKTKKTPKRPRAAPEKVKKRTDPTTVRLRAHLDVWLHEMVDEREYPGGQSGLLNDAMDHYKRHLEAKRDLISGAIGGGS